MSIRRVLSYPIPSEMKTPEEISLYLRNLYRALCEDEAARTRDFSNYTDMGVMSVKANVTNATTTAASVTGLAFGARANKNYGFRFILKTTTAATTTGIHFQFSGPASPTSFFAVVRQWLDGPVANTEWLTAFDSSTVAANYAQNTDVVIEGFLVNGANNGIVQLKVDSEVGTSTVTVYAGSWGIWHLLD